MTEEEKDAQKKIIRKIEQFCTFRERSIREVRLRLIEYEAEKELAEEVLAYLMDEDFIDEERFAAHFAIGKHRSRKWGRIKIRYELRKKDLEPRAIESGLNQLDEDEYLENLKTLLDEKSRESKSVTNAYVRNKKIADHLLRKGYESDIVWSLIKKAQ